MKKFKRGDILWGTERGRKEAWHPIVFIDGPSDAPLAVVLTHKKDHLCNIELGKQYDNEKSYFIAHLIEKMYEWGPYEKSDKLKLDPNDLALIEQHIQGTASMSYAQYEEYTKGGCPDHK